MGVDAIASGAITITGLTGIRYVRQMKIENIPSMHPTAYVECGLKDKIPLERLEFTTDVVQIIADSKMLFTGLVENIQIEEISPDAYILKLWLVARSKLLDIEPRCRSFQKVSVRYADIIQSVAEATQGIYVNNRLQVNAAIGAPLIQYNETDWEYIKRLASKCNEPVIVDEQGTVTELLIGKWNHVMNAEFIEGYHKRGYSNSYYTKQMASYGISRAYTMYYVVRSYGNYPVGYQVSYQGQLYYICEKRAFLEKELVVWEYVLSHEQYLFEPTIYNDKLVGGTILGDTVATEKETVKLNLHLKDEEDTGVYHAYNWVPETGNMMYCMPMTGTMVSLYFPDDDETTAMVVNSMRWDEEEGYAADDPTVKSFITEEGDALIMADTCIHLLTQKDDVVTNQLTLLDEEGLLFRSVKRIRMHSDTGIAIEGGTVLIEAKNNIGFDQGRCDENDVSFNFFGFYAGVFHMVGQDGLRIVLAGYYKDKGFGIIMDVPEIGERKLTGKMKFNLLLGVLTVGAIAALCVFALPLVLGGLGVAAGTASAIAAGAAGGAIVTGIFAVGEKTMEDYNRGEATDPWAFWGNVTVKTVGGAIEGGICALAGPVTWAGSKAKIAKKIGTKLLCDQAGNAVATISDNLIDGDAWNKDLGLTSVTTLITGGVFDILPATPFGKTMSGKAKEVSDKIGKRFASTDAGKKVSKFFGGLVSDIKGKWQQSTLYQKYLAGLGQKNYISHINNTRDSLEKLDDALADAIDAKNLLTSDKKDIDDEIKLIKQQLGQGGDVDALKEQLEQLQKQRKKLEIDIGNKANTVKNLGDKLKKSNKLIQKVLKQENTKYISLAVSKKMWRTLYIDTLNALGGKIKSEGIKKIIEEAGKKIEDMSE